VERQFGADFYSLIALGGERQQWLSAYPVKGYVDFVLAARPVVEGAIDLDHRIAFRVVGQVLAGRQPFGIEGTGPILVRPATRTDVDWVHLADLAYPDQ
jgi:hypothetical protein